VRANALTIDVEDYFQVSALAPYIQRADWDKRECRVERNIRRILEMLAGQGIVATFFTLGWIAERYPGLVRAIVAGGHELASHGYGHARANELTAESFLDDISRAKQILEDISGVAVQGYRAPSFSIDNSNRQWAFEALARAGYRYSSSVYPVAHDHYGVPDAPRFVWRPLPELLEVPPTTVHAFGRNWPASGGGFFRLLPYGISRRLIERVNRTDGQSAVFYFHPWEIDPAQPRIPNIDAKTRFRHYINLHRMEEKLMRLFGDFRWGRMDHIFLAA
jgi:polysaccharide deacetylase family protein (PEP-CTERM system associated)